MRNIPPHILLLPWVIKGLQLQHQFRWAICKKYSESPGYSTKFFLKEFCIYPFFFYNDFYKIVDETVFNDASKNPLLFIQIHFDYYLIEIPERISYVRVCDLSQRNDL